MYEPMTAYLYIDIFPINRKRFPFHENSTLKKRMYFNQVHLITFNIRLADNPLYNQIDVFRVRVWSTDDLTSIEFCINTKKL